MGEVYSMVYWSGLLFGLRIFSGRKYCRRWDGVLRITANIYYSLDYIFYHCEYIPTLFQGILRNFREINAGPCRGYALLFPHNAYHSFARLYGGTGRTCANTSRGLRITFNCIGGLEFFNCRRILSILSGKREEMETKPGERGSGRRDYRNCCTWSSRQYYFNLCRSRFASAWAGNQ